MESIIEGNYATNEGILGLEQVRGKKRQREGEERGRAIAIASSRRAQLANEPALVHSQASHADGHRGFKQSRYVYKFTKNIAGNSRKQFLFHGIKIITYRVSGSNL